MDSLIKLAESNAWLTGIAVVILTGFSAMKIYLDYRLEITKKGSEE